MNYQIKFTTKWSDFDPNRHMRHTAYNEYAAEVRVRYFASAGFPIDVLVKDSIGPILFTEHTSFKKEILMGKDIVANIKLSGLSKDGRKWKIRHEIFNDEKQVSAIIDVYGAWIDLEKRKLTVLPKKYDTLFDGLEKTKDFEVIGQK